MLQTGYNEILAAWNQSSDLEEGHRNIIVLAASNDIVWYEQPVIRGGVIIVTSLLYASVFRVI